jgi:hypothetical protein
MEDQGRRLVVIEADADPVVPLGHGAQTAEAVHAAPRIAIEVETQIALAPIAFSIGVFGGKY